MRLSYVRERPLNDFQRQSYEGPNHDIDVVLRGRHEPGVQTRLTLRKDES
jgi:hypothetical protein